MTIFFTLEYLIRVWVARKPGKYVWSFYGIVDLVSILPSYLGLFFTGAHALVVIRALRLLRVFRILKMSRYVGESRSLMIALKASSRKIIVFMIFVLIVVTII